MKIGIMGGTFNPIHKGHLALAQAAFKQYRLDKVWFMPSGLPAHKSNSELLPADIRLHMVHLAIKDYPEFEASSFEIDVTSHEQRFHAPFLKRRVADM